MKLIKHCWSWLYKYKQK